MAARSARIGTAKKSSSQAEEHSVPSSTADSAPAVPPAIIPCALSMENCDAARTIAQLARGAFPASPVSGPGTTRPHATGGQRARRTGRGVSAGHLATRKYTGKRGRLHRRPAMVRYRGRTDSRLGSRKLSRGVVPEPDRTHHHLFRGALLGRPLPQAFVVFQPGRLAGLGNTVVRAAFHVPAVARTSRWPTCAAIVLAILGLGHFWCRRLADLSPTADAFCVMGMTCSSRLRCAAPGKSHA